MFSWSSFNQLLSHVTIVKTTDNGERGMNPVTMTIINPRKEYLLSWKSNSQKPVHESDMLTTEPHRQGDDDDDDDADGDDNDDPRQTYPIILQDTINHLRELIQHCKRFQNKYI